MRKIVIVSFLFPILFSCSKPISNTELFENAIRDVLYADESKIRPLVNLIPSDDNVIFNADKSKVLMCTLHHYPNSYPEGEDVVNSWGDGWLVSVKEFAKWYKTNKGKFSDYTLRSKQLLGVSINKEHTHLSSFYANVSDLIRPAYEPDTTKPIRLSLPSEASDDYKKWFNDNITSSYSGNNRSPWTRLGYTYDWSGTSDRYGLSEFLLPKGHTIHIEKTLLINDFYTNYLENI